MGVSGISTLFINTVVKAGIEVGKNQLKRDEAVIKTLNSLGIPIEPGGMSSVV